jgi:hypothetical protein
LANKTDLKPLTVSENLPWLQDGVPLPEVNKKHLYVGLDQIAQNPAFETLNTTLGGGIDEITTVSAYFVIDAKQPLPNLELIIDVVKNARLTTDISGVISRTCQVSQTFKADVVITEFEFSFRKLITNT